MPHLPLRPNLPTPSPSSSASPPPQRRTPQPRKEQEKPDNAVLFVNFSNPAVDRKAKSNKVAIKKWVTKRQHAAARNQAPFHLNPQANSSHIKNVQKSAASGQQQHDDLQQHQKDQQLQRLLALQASPPPGQLVAAKTIDPFGRLPVDINDHASQLIYVYLNACTASLAAFANREHTRALLSVVRKNAWHPLAIQSSAAYNAMVVFAQVSQGLNTAPAELCLRTHTAQALTAANAELTSLQGADNSDALCFAVVLLMISAQRVDDRGSFHAHARGLSALIYRRARARNAKTSITPAEQLVIDNETREMAIGPKRWDSLISPEKLDPSIPHVPGFHQLMNSGYCSSVTASFLAQVVAIFEICLQAQGDWLVINSMFQHVFVDDGVYKRLWAHSPKQVYLILCARLCQHYALWPMREHPCHTTEFAVTSLHRQLQAIDVADILEVCPGAMLWVSIIGGAGTVGPLQSYYSWLMHEACRRLPGMHSYEVARSYLYENFLWAPGADPAAMAFWESAVLGSPRRSPTPSDSDGSQPGSPRARRKKRPDSAELSVPALGRGPADLGFCSGAERPMTVFKEVVYQHPS